MIYCHSLAITDGSIIHRVIELSDEKRIEFWKQ